MSICVYIFGKQFKNITMKKASFKATITSPCGTKSSTAYGSVTLKDDNKVSISIQDRNWLSYKLVSHANSIAKEIVSSDFNHSSIIGQVESSDSGILGILMTETTQLKADLLTRTEAYANNQFNHIMSTISEVQVLYKTIGAEWSEARKNKTDTYSIKKEYYRVEKKLDNMQSILQNGLPTHIEKSLKNAEEHYTSSLSKLALRITQKEMDMTNFKLVSGYVGMNLEMTMTDGVKSVRAWTIWAAEDSTMVSPHYRYLVK